MQPRRPQRQERAVALEAQVTHLERGGANAGDRSSAERQAQSDAVGEQDGREIVAEGVEVTPVQRPGDERAVVADACRDVEARFERRPQRHRVRVDDRRPEQRAAGVVGDALEGDAEAFEAGVRRARGERGDRVAYRVEQRGARQGARVEQVFLDQERGACVVDDGRAQPIDRQGGGDDAGRAGGERDGRLGPPASPALAGRLEHALRDQRGDQRRHRRRAEAGALTERRTRQRGPSPAQGLEQAVAVLGAKVFAADDRCAAHSIVAFRVVVRVRWKNNLTQFGTCRHHFFQS